MAQKENIVGAEKLFLILGISSRNSFSSYAPIDYKPLFCFPETCMNTALILYSFLPCTSIQQVTLTLSVSLPNPNHLVSACIFSPLGSVPLLMVTTPQSSLKWNPAMLSRLLCLLENSGSQKMLKQCSLVWMLPLPGLQSNCCSVDALVISLIMNLLSHVDSTPYYYMQIIQVLNHFWYCATLSFLW